MPTLTSQQTVKLDIQEAFGPLYAIRAEVVRRLRANTTLVALLGSTNKIVRRFRRAPLSPSDLPIITYFDFGSNIDNIVPLMELTFQIDVWAENTETLSELVIATLDQKPFGVLVGGEANVTFLHCTDFRDNPVEEGDMERKVLTFRVIAYRLK
jgi:hypothetical protein